MRLALFDFDGTITYSDTLAAFIQYAVGKKNYYLGLLYLSPILFLFALKIYPNDLAKQKLLAYFFKNWDAENFKKVSYHFSINEMPKLIRPQALNCLHEHQKNNDTVAVVSASCRHWLEPWCKQQNILLLCTELEVKESHITGHFAGKNCHGMEKEKRIKAAFDLSKFSEIIAYGDSAGDQQMLQMANKAFYKPFR
jgi:phosphatidylglycerophosphatase C